MYKYILFACSLNTFVIFGVCCAALLLLGAVFVSNLPHAKRPKSTAHALRSHRHPIGLTACWLSVVFVWFLQTVCCFCLVNFRETLRLLLLKFAEFCNKSIVSPSYCVRVCIYMYACVYIHIYICIAMTFVGASF